MVQGSTLQQRYVVGPKIGDGGMQAVFRAYDNLIERDVALKTPLPGQASKKFSDSAVTAGRVNNPYIAKTYDYFEESGASYLVEELVDGDNLEEVVPEGQSIDPNTAAHLMLSLAKGIAASHHAGVVHRDLKPSNVVCVRGSLLSIVKITDFGIATLTDEVFAEEAQSGELTKSTSGTIKGAIPFMSPEMLFRQPGDHPGRASDVWSLGAMMFKLLTGEFPFGVAMMVPVNIKTGNRTAWPAFMRSKSQFVGLVDELQKIVESCLIEDETKRPAADDIVAACENLCLSTANRSGVVDTVSGNTGRIRARGGGLVHFHVDSVYGSRALAVSDSVMFASYPGTPYPRAHPVSVLPAKA